MAVHVYPACHYRLVRSIYYHIRLYFVYDLAIINENIHLFAFYPILRVVNRPIPYLYRHLRPQDYTDLQ